MPALSKVLPLRRRKSGRFGWPLCTLVALSAALPAQNADAGQPACFAERTVLEASELSDGEGNRLGGVRAGQVVRLLAEDETGDVLVAVKDQVSVRGYVRGEKLRVFLKRDVKIEKDRWWLAGTPVRLHAPKGGTVEVEWIGPHGEVSDSSVRVPCRLLSGRPVTALVVDGCHGAGVAGHPVPTGKPVHFREDSATALDESPPLPPRVLSGESVGLLREKGDRSYVEVIEAGRFSERVRIRAWVNRAEVLPGPPEQSGYTEHLCCEGMLFLEVGLRGGVLERPVMLRTAPGAKPFASVPAGARFRVLGEPRDGMRQIVFLFPRWDTSEFTLTLQGWVPSADLPPIQVSTPKDALVGHLVVQGKSGPRDFRGFVVSASSRGPNGPASVMAEPDGHFMLEVPHSGAVRLDARSSDGSLAGAVNDTLALPGGNDDVTITLKPASHIEGRVRNRVGAWLPNVDVLGLAQDARECSIHVRTDGSGKFRMPVVPGKYALTAFEPGMQWGHFVHASAPTGDVTLELWRRRTILGAVPRMGKTCATSEIEIRTHPSEGSFPHFRRRYPVAADCTFAADGIGRAWNPIDIEFVGGAKQLDTTWGPDGDYRKGMWDEDPPPVCLGGGCALHWERASIHANVVGPDGVLLMTPVQVDAVAGNENGRCQATAGTCFVHHLTPTGTATVTARQGTKTASARVKLGVGVQEVLLRLE